MSRRKRARKGASAQPEVSSKSAGTKPQPQLPPADPLKPRPKLLVVLSMIFAAWVAFLLVLYFTTIMRP